MSSAEEYKDMAYTELVLPTGKEAVVKEPDMMALVEFYAELGIQLDDPERIVKLGGMTTAERIFQVIKVLVPAAMVKPKVVLSNPKMGEMKVTDIKNADLMFLVEWIMDCLKTTAEAQESISFPDGQSDS